MIIVMVVVQFHFPFLSAVVRGDKADDSVREVDSSQDDTLTLSRQKKQSTF